MGTLALTPPGEMESFPVWGRMAFPSSLGHHTHSHHHMRDAETGPHDGVAHPSDNPKQQQLRSERGPQAGSCTAPGCPQAS
eukprot:5734909-Amphidinium_carterae.3